MPLPVKKSKFKKIERELFYFNFLLLKADLGVLVPAFDFKQETTGNYKVTLVYRLLANGKWLEFGDFEYDTFDRFSVESFRKVDNGKIEEKPNAQEFLMQASIGGFFDLGVPGKESMYIQGLGLAPIEAPSESALALSENHPAEEPRRMMPGKDFMQIMQLISSNQIPCEGESLVEKHKESYYTALAAYASKEENQKISVKELQRMLLKEHQLVSPDNMEIFLFDAFYDVAGEE